MKQKNKKSMRDPMSMFFSLGDKVTRGDPARKADFDYYLMWLIFIAFISIFIGNVWRFIQNPNLVSLGWAAFIIGILWFQYNGLKQFYGMRKMMKEAKGKPQKPMKIEGVEKMLEEFKNAK